MGKTIKIPINISPFYIEVDVPIFIYQEIEFGITQHSSDDYSLHDITHINSGLGFNGIIGKEVTLKNVKNHLEHRLNAVGEDEFFKVLNNALSVEDNIQRFKNEQAKNDENKESFKELGKLLQLQIPFCNYSLLANQLRIDIIKFEKLLINKGYNPDGVSIKEYVQEHYGDRAVELITKLL